MAQLIINNASHDKDQGVEKLAADIFARYMARQTGLFYDEDHAATSARKAIKMAEVFHAELHNHRSK